MHPKFARMKREVTRQEREFNEFLAHAQERQRYLDRKVRWAAFYFVVALAVMAALIFLYA